MKKAQAKKALKKAIEIAGSKSALQRLTGYSRQNIRNWEKRGYAACEAAPDIEKATGVSKEELRGELQDKGK